MTGERTAPRYFGHLTEVHAVTGGPADLVIYTEVVFKAPMRASSFAYFAPL